MPDNPHMRVVKIISGVLVGAGVLLLVFSLLPGVGIKLGLPLLFLMLGAAFILMVYTLSPGYHWAAVLFIPAGVLLAFGVIFLLNVITGDWNAWAYAWLLLVAGAGAGLVLSDAHRPYWRQGGLVGWIMAASGIVLFALFGAIAGGAFIYIMAPVLLVLGGLALRWTGLGKVLAERLHRRAGQIPPAGNSTQTGLVEALSAREIEVLRLIDQGLTNAEIAARLTVAQSTVKTHINNIYGKLGVESRIQAVNRGRELGLLGEPSSR